MVSVEDNKLKGTVEAILFASPLPVELDKLCAVLERRPDEIKEIIDEIEKDLSDKYMGVQLSVHGSTYRLCTKEEYAEAVAAYVAKGRTPGLSNAAMEVLAIVAYNQPTTKTYVSQVRGVASAEVMESLVDKDLLEPQGRLDLPGRPMSYGTTDKFLTVFGLESIEALPSRELFMEGLAGIQNEDQPVEVYEQQQIFEETES
ncbi:MAG: SMC-Scp complex subunit ScpB [Ruminococcaceae bacterium]|nr:SMC-Scp complex subunit ScpB [Oscillospiraceae bacterium]